MARPTTQRGVESCTVTLSSESATVQAMPLSSSAGRQAQSVGATARIAVPTIAAAAAKRTRCSLSKWSRSRALLSAPITAPTPKQPSMMPKVEASPPSLSCATRGSSESTATEPKPKRKARPMTFIRFGDMAT